ncbi:hypothetical protein CPB83DRAFT_838695 [Crepidotus variabilis]|uniref:Uncharacterized protein n=1 Tax=Crepidotus variabilis TaxID=179855 RepID=A0A9P6E918_9AGAR|nr:hypothetical protein CPB83DRAFT_838695 [Crepidotus variabilis]
MENSSLGRERRYSALSVHRYSFVPQISKVLIRTTVYKTGLRICPRYLATLPTIGSSMLAKWIDSWTFDGDRSLSNSVCVKPPSISLLSSFQFLAFTAFLSLRATMPPILKLSSFGELSRRDLRFRLYMRRNKPSQCAQDDVATRSYSAKGSILLALALRRIGRAELAVDGTLVDHVTSGPSYKDGYERLRRADTPLKVTISRPEALKKMLFASIACTYVVRIFKQKIQDMVHTTQIEVNDLNHKVAQFQAEESYLVCLAVTGYTAEEVDQQYKDIMLDDAIPRLYGSDSGEQKLGALMFDIKLDLVSLSLVNECDSFAAETGCLRKIKKCSSHTRRQAVNCTGVKPIKRRCVLPLGADTDTKLSTEPVSTQQVNLWRTSVGDVFDLVAKQDYKVTNPSALLAVLTGPRYRVYFIAILGKKDRDNLV